MTELEVRAIIANGLENGACFALRNNGWTDAFLSGSRDVELAEMDIDSLAIMELCIAIEVETGISVLPDEVAEKGSLGRIAARVHDQLR